MIKTLVYQELSILSSREAEVNPYMLMSIKKMLLWCLARLSLFGQVLKMFELKILAMLKYGNVKYFIGLI